MAEHRKRVTLEEYNHSNTEKSTEYPVEKDRFESELALTEIISATKYRSQSRGISLHGMHETEDVIELSEKRSAFMLAENIEKISKIDITELKEEETQEPDNAADKEKSVSGVEVGILRGENLIKSRHRGSIYYPRRSSIFPLPIVAVRSALEEIHRKVIEDQEISPMREPSEKFEASSSVQFVEPTKQTLSAIEAAVIDCILRECLDQLTILRYAIPAEINKHWPSFFGDAAEKYDVPNEPEHIFREDMGLAPLIISTAEKMQRDRTYVHEILEQTADEVKRLGTFDKLEVEVDNIAKMRQEERNMETSCHIRQNQLKQLQRFIESSKRKNTKEVKVIEMLSRKTNAEVDDVMYINAAELGYGERWEKARLQQQDYRISSREHDLLDKLNQYYKMQNVEEVVLREVSAYLETNIKNLESDLEIWTARYREEIEKRQQEIDDLRVKIEEQKLAIEDMYAIKSERQIFIDACYAEMEKEEAEAKHKAMLHRAANVIQSMWRGYMVRNQLGQYKGLWRKLRKRKRLAAKRRKAEEAKREMEEKNEQQKKYKGRRIV